MTQTTLDERQLNGVGREGLLDRLGKLHAENVTLRERLETEADQTRRVRTENKALTDQVTELQKGSNAVLASHRLAKVLEHEPELMTAMLDLAWGIDKARTKHPEGSTLRDLVSEVGEVATAMWRETPERVNEELLDVAIVAMRMRLGEGDARNNEPKDVT